MRRLTTLFLFVALTIFAADAPQIDFGRIEQLTYTHDYFGFHLSIPQSWQVQDSESRDRLMKMGKEVIVGNNQNMKAILESL